MKVARNVRKEIRARAGVANISEKIREESLEWLDHVERKTEEDVVMRTWKWVDIEISGVARGGNRAHASPPNLLVTVDFSN